MSGAKVVTFYLITNPFRLKDAIKFTIGIFTKSEQMVEIRIFSTQV